MSQSLRTSVDLGDHPDLVVIYLGMRVRTLRGMQTLRSIGKEIEQAATAQPDGLLRHETLWYSLIPPHGGMRQYWRDFDALERWTRTLPHKQWWGRFLRDSAGTGFWHETYFRRGGIEAIYVDTPAPLGLLAFAPARPATGSMFSSRRRAGLGGQELAPVIAESELKRSPRPTH
jgi:Monooxygenase af470-like